jgi:hypothetical protein
MMLYVYEITTEHQATTRKCLAVVERIISRKVDSISEAVARPSRSPYLIAIDFSLWKHPKKQDMTLPPWPIDYLVDELKQLCRPSTTTR